MEVDGARQVANAEVDKMIEAKTRSMEQQAMLQEKVAEKLWDLRRWNTGGVIMLEAHLILFQSSCPGGRSVRVQNPFGVENPMIKFNPPLPSMPSVQKAKEIYMT